MKAQFETPILYLMFNRPDLVKQTFPQIKAQRPKKLFFASDGPRKGNENDQAKCAECREWVLSQIDWDCEVKTLFREENLGCGLAVSQAITWFFEHVEIGIILEDDCVVSNSFFSFCEMSLIIFENDDSVAHISGTNPLQNTNNSFYKTKYANVWGWATWKKSWALFDFQCNSLDFDATKSVYFSKKEKIYWEKISQELLNLKVDSWAYRWQFSLWKNNRLSIFSGKNLVSNIGFGIASTHTQDQSSSLNNIARSNNFDLALKSNSLSEEVIKIDKLIFKYVYQSKTSLLNRTRNFGYFLLPNAFWFYYRKIKTSIGL